MFELRIELPNVCSDRYLNPSRDWRDISDC